MSESDVFGHRYRHDRWPRRENPKRSWRKTSASSLQNGAWRSHIWRTWRASASRNSGPCSEGRRRRHSTGFKSWRPPWTLKSLTCSKTRSGAAEKMETALNRRARSELPKGEQACCWFSGDDAAGGALRAGFVWRGAEPATSANRRLLGRSSSRRANRTRGCPARGVTRWNGRPQRSNRQLGEGDRWTE